MTQRRYRVRGVVQGVGFRPFVFRNATRVGLNGTVWNDADGVVICVDGTDDQVSEFLTSLTEDPPPLAWIGELIEEPNEPFINAKPFAIQQSEATSRINVPVSPDIAPCEDCLREFRDPNNRRFGYPFLNCTNCGPRFTIVEALPYDRERTTMRGFPMCARCQDEYEDPSDRRFHAQPTACADCGPKLWIEPAFDGDPIDVAARLLTEGKIVAIKAIGGFHLAVDATNEDAVDALRDRKQRDDKPFAILVRDLVTANELVSLDDESTRRLTSPVRPIVLAPRRSRADVAFSVAEGTSELGVMLPSSAIQVALTDRCEFPLVMTSGNISDEPISFENADAKRKLARVADAYLLHDRPIHNRCDDSIMRGDHVLRRARGLVPAAFRGPRKAAQSILAVGAELKNTIAITRGEEIFGSHHIGDLEQAATYFSFQETIERLGDLLDVEPTVIAHDLHPEYLSTKYAQESDRELLPVQHHHAHVASCLIDNRHPGPVIALAYDGHGYGPDGTLWGGELLLADFTHYQRLGHLPLVGLPGAAIAAREPWRMAVAWVGQVIGEDAVKYFAREYDFDLRWPEVLTISTAPRTLRTSSMGRLFDAAAFFVTRRHVATFEAQAAMELEALAHQSSRQYTFSLPELEPQDITLASLFSELLGACVAEVPPPDIAFAFHEAIAQNSVRIAANCAEQHGIEAVALTGGVFQNVLLTELCVAGLTERGLTALTHHDVPANDGGIAIGQAAIALTAIGESPEMLHGI